MDSLKYWRVKHIQYICTINYGLCVILTGINIQTI